MSDYQKSNADSVSPQSPQTDDDLPDEFLSPNTVGRELGVSGVAVKQWIYQRRLQASKLANGYWRISRRNLKRFLEERTGGAKRRIMLVGAAATAARDSLLNIGWQPIVAHNPIDAVLRAVDSKPAMAIIDLDSLGEGGWSAAEELRSTRGTLRIPILLLVSADVASNPKAIARSVALGAQGCITLPVEEDSLITTVKELLGA